MGGHSGNDLVSGGYGRDNLYSGDGNDTIYANDQTSDGDIYCGSGDDTVHIDRTLDKFSGCEHVVAYDGPVIE